ncbi:precorrin-6Y C5,15-methyltransferase (decarboxylating) [Bathymodiolus japonicus methanotrophic gill symbiont]|uniref:precorrin-6y C5,15-methyltransferase (decarboxylating) subunit CbiE n=1 Tax=Bathymodiolus japonicus methanotrophic gill symbiont TaxID=113269 RepID=UPI001B68E753|nr:precorrin-6y C5,15-methyltransferase (decarboxylating) subunit CbiE [Bathymodiolus japonicus methanotrophic gill symbiont]GFO71369.1 precorrin-6Y C5,15-methyltransferase (decarboxylating) [Bathymodiolus japonicus methanotrophic gill symbiont]
MAYKCQIIGVLDNGLEGLSFAALNALQNAEVVIAATRVLTLFADSISAAECKDLSGNLAKVPEWINSALTRKKSVVVLATGDPLCHGIASFLTKKLGAEQLEILPNVSSVQLAFASIGMAWQDAKICSVHNKDAGEWQTGFGREHGFYNLLQAINQHDKLAILTSPENDPSRIAHMLVMENMADLFSMVVAENLLCTDEKIFQDISIAELAGQIFSGNDVVILCRLQAKQPELLFGYADHAFKQRKPDKGLITKREVRAVSLARMQLTAESITWDIGAGSGSVGIEAAKLCTKGHVYAVEKNVADFAIASENARDFALHNYTIIENKAPRGMEYWPAPDAIFIGGSGGELAELIALSLERLQANGCLVMNFVTLGNLTTALEILKQSSASWDITQLQASRSQPILHMHRMRAENPVWVVCAQKTIHNGVNT